MSEFDKNISRSFENRMQRTRNREKFDDPGVDGLFGMAFNESKEAYSVSHGNAFANLIRLINRFGCKIFSRLQNRLKVNYQKDPISELREGDFLLAVHSLRYKVKESFMKEFNGTPKTLCLLITFPIWLPWLVIKTMKTGHHKKG